MKGYTVEEFSKYVESLQFEELEDVGNFILEYYQSYKNVPEEPGEEKDLAFQKYLVLLSRFGLLFINFSMSVIYLRKVIDESFKEEN